MNLAPARLNYGRCPTVRPTITALILGVLICVGHGQPSDPVSAPGSGSRLQQLESTFQQELKKIHIPLLGQYLTELQRLAASTTDPAAQSAIRAEMEKVQQIVTAGGVVDPVAAAQASQAPAAASMPATPKPGAPPVPAPILTLAPAGARSFTPSPSTGLADAPLCAAIGQADWMIDRLPAGGYEILIQYACPKLDTEQSVLIEFAGQTLEHEFKPSRVTKSANDFRLVRLGRITLKTDATHELLRLKAGSRSEPVFHLRSLMIVPAKASAP